MTRDKRDSERSLLRLLLCQRKNRSAAGVVLVPKPTHLLKERGVGLPGGGETATAAVHNGGF